MTHRPPFTPLVLLGYFDDDAIISALTRLSTDPEIPVILAQAVLHVWTAYGGVKSSPAFNIAMYFENRNEWSTVMEEQWNRIGLGLPFSPRLMDASDAFFSSCSRRLTLWGPTIALNNASRALQPAEALKQARLRHLAWVTTIPNKDPVEVGSSRQDRLPRTAVPSKMQASPHMKLSCSRWQ